MLGHGLGIWRSSLGGVGGTSAGFVGAPFVEGTSDSSVTIRISRASIGASYAYEITSSGGGTPVSGSGTVSAEAFDITGINLTGLNAGTLTLSYEEDSVEVATGTALLLPPFDILLADDGVTPLLADDGVTELTAD